MALTINTNQSSMIVQSNLTKSTNQLNSAIERMTTGYKINHASDNAAGYSIAKNWDAKLSSLDVAADNAATGADMLSTLEDNYALVSTHLQRIRDLTEQASNGTYGKESKMAIESEIKARIDEINRIAENCEYNGINLMKGTAGTLKIQVGLDATAAKSQISLDSTLFADSTIGGLLSSFSSTAAPGGVTLANIVKAANSGTAVTISAAGVSTDAQKHALASAFAGLIYKSSDGTFTEQTTANYTPEQMLGFLDKAISLVSTRVTSLGAAQNRIESAIESIAVQSENITSSLSTLRDADVATESSNYIKAQILQQASATLLATANQTPSIALNLL